MQKDLKHICIYTVRVKWVLLRKGDYGICDAKHLLLGQKCGQKSPRREEVGNGGKLRCSNLKPN